MGASGEMKEDWTAGEHIFRAPDKNCSRSPCPALNALANHNIIPHSGNDLTFSQIYSAVRSVYNLSIPMAAFVTFGGFVLCGHRFGTRLNLHDLAKHNRIEHNASLVHEDAKDGEKWANFLVDHELLEKLITQGQGEDNANSNREDGITLQDLLNARLRRLSEMPTSRNPPLSLFHRLMVTGETALVLLTLGDTGDEKGKVDREKLRTWFGEERLPDGWTGVVSGKDIGIWKTNGVGNMIKTGIKNAEGKSWDGKKGKKDD